MRGVAPAVLLMLAGLASGQPQVAFDKNEEGLKLAYRGESVAAERLYREAITLWRDAGPRYEAHLATSELNLAQALSAEGRRPEAAKAMEDSLAHFRGSLGIRDLNTLTALNLLAGTDVMLGNSEAARALYDEALPIERELFPTDLQLGRTLIGLAGLEMQQNRYEEALAPAEEALRVILQATGEAGADAALAYATVAEIHRGANRPDRALPLFRKARELYDKALGPDHPRIASILAQEALVLMAQGKDSMAERDLLRAIGILDQRCPGCVNEKFVAETNLALLRTKQHKYEEADRLLSDAIGLQERYQHIPGGDLASSLRALAFVRQKERLYEDAARLQKRADALLTYR